MDQTLDQIVKSKNIKFNGKLASTGMQKKPFNNQQKMGGGKMFFQNRRQGFNQMRPRGNFTRNFGGMGGGMRRPMFKRQNFGMFQQRRNFNNQGGTMTRNFNPMRRNFQQQRPMRNFQQQGVQQMRFRPQPQMQQNRPFGGGNMMRNNNMGSNMSGQQQPATKLYVSNLDFGVSNQDIKELFSEFGPMVRYGVNHSTAGRSVGTAEVIFKNRMSAVKACQKYNGVTLDGRPMNIEVSGGAPQQQNNRPQFPLRPMQQRQQPMRMSPLKRIVNPRPRPVMNNRPAFNNKFNRPGFNNKFNRPGFVRNRQNTIAAQLARRAKNTMMLKNNRMGMKGKMNIKGKKAEPDVNQLDADLEAYANSKD